MNAKRRTRSARNTEERLRYKFIDIYVKNLHKDIHRQAQELYEFLREKYPGVRDLTKTSEYMKAVMPNTPIPRHYTSKQREHLTRQDPTPQSHMSQMVLNIPLMKVQPTPQPLPQPLQPLPQPLPLPQDDLLLPPDVYQSLLNELQKDPDLKRILDGFQDNADDTFMPGELTDLELELEGVYANTA